MGMGENYSGLKCGKQHKECGGYAPLRELHVAVNRPIVGRQRIKDD